MRRLLIGLAAAFVALVVLVMATPAVLQWWSVRSSGNPDVALSALSCETGGGRVVRSVETRPWGWVVRTATWRVAYLGADDNASGAPATFVTLEGDGDTSRLVPWFSGSAPPTDPATGKELTAKGAENPWEADMALAAELGRDPLVAQRCSTRRL